MSVVYVLTTPIPEDGGENPTVDQVRRRVKWDNDDYVCRGLILNAKYMVEDASSNKFLVSNFTNYKMTDSRPVLEQYNELLGILGRHNDNKGKRKHHDTRANPNKKPKVTCWKCGKPRHLKKDCKAGNVGNRANGSNTKGSEDGSSNPLKGQNMFNKSLQIYYVTYVFEAYFVQDDDIAWRVDSRATVHVCKYRCWFKTYESLNGESILHMVNESTALVHGRGCVDLRDVIFDEHWFSSVSRPSQRSLKDRTEDSGGLVVSERVTGEVVQQPESELRKSKRHRTPKDFRIEFELYLIEGTRDEISDQHSYFFNFEDDPKTFDEAIKSQDVAFSKETINDEIDSIMGNNTWVLTDLPIGCRPLGCKWSFKRKLKVDLTKEFLSLRFSMKDMREADVILGIRIKHESNGIAISQSHYIDKVLIKFNYSDFTPVSTPLDTCEKLMPNKGPAVSQLEYSRVIGCLMYVVTCTRPDIAFVMGKLSRYTSNPGAQHWQAIQRVLKYLKKTIDYRLVYSGYPSVLEATSKEAEWLKNLLLEIPLWVKPIAPVSIRCNSIATLAKAYSQMYNGKSRHLVSSLTEWYSSVVDFIRGLMASACNLLGDIELLAGMLLGELADISGH
nr:zinc finger, CCHC-type [Tanacetum cinerariifolium]